MYLKRRNKSVSTESGSLELWNEYIEDAEQRADIEFEMVSDSDSDFNYATHGEDETETKRSQSPIADEEIESDDLTKDNTLQEYSAPKLQFTPSSSSTTLSADDTDPPSSMNHKSTFIFSSSSISGAHSDGHGLYGYTDPPSDTPIRQQQHINEQSDDILTQYSTETKKKFPILHACYTTFLNMWNTMAKEDIQNLIFSTKTHDFLIACTNIYDLLYALPRKIIFDSLGPARRDVNKNIVKIRRCCVDNPEKTSLLIHVHKYDSLSLLWLNRGLHFISRLISKIVNNKKMSLSQCALRAYADTLQMYHTPPMRAIAKIVLHYSISRDNFLNSVSNNMYSYEDPTPNEKSKVILNELVMLQLADLSANMRLVADHVDKYISYHEHKQLQPTVNSLEGLLYTNPEPVIESSGEEIERVDTPEGSDSIDTKSDSERNYPYSYTYEEGDPDDSQIQKSCKKEEEED